MGNPGPYVEERITDFMNEAVGSGMEKGRIGREEGRERRGRGKTYYRLQQSHASV